MSNDKLIPADFKLVVPKHAANVGRWMRLNGVGEDIIEVLVENAVSGDEFKDLRESDLKDLFPLFSPRKKLRDWLNSVVCGKIPIRDLPDAFVRGAVSPSAVASEIEEDAEQHDDEALSEIIESSVPSSSSSRKSSGKEMIEPSEASNSPVSSFKRKAKVNKVQSPGPLSKQPRLSVNQKRTSPPNLETGNTEVNADNDLVQLSAKLALMVPPSIKKCREEGVAITSKARVDMVKNSLIILQGQIGRNKPTNAEFEVCAQKIVQLVPELKDPIPPIRKDAFKQWGTVLVQLKKSYYNRKMVEKPRKNNNSQMETESTEESHLQLLQREMKAAKPDSKKIHSLMVASYRKRRQWIESLKGKGTVKQILEDYPGFKCYNQLILEMKLMSKTDEYQKAWSELTPQLWEYVTTMSTSEIDLEELDEDDKACFIMQALPSAWDIKDSFLQIIEESQEFNRFLKKLSGESHLLIVDDDDDLPQIFLVIENEVVLELESYQKALFAMVAVHHVFNIHYPKNLKLCFQFLDEYVFGITPLKKTVQYSKGVRKLFAKQAS